MKYYIIAGEASGDLHGSNLVKELFKVDADAVVRCWGGDKMQAAGGELVKHYRELAFMGFTEVLMNLRTIFRNITFCKQDILQWKPDTLVLIDYPGFNLRIAEWAKSQGIKVIYYISPQVWAWKENRVKMMKRSIDKMIVILPFEQRYFRDKWNWDVEYVGHPLIEAIEAHRRNSAGASISDKPVIAVLPGSRKQEISIKLPIMLAVSNKFPGHQFVVAKAPGVEETFYDGLMKQYKNVSYVSNRTYDLLSEAKAAMVTSGTATLETALFHVPEVVCYKGSPISYQIAKRVIKVKFISLVNLIMDRLVVKELIQNELTPDNIAIELQRLLSDQSRIEQLRSDYRELDSMLGKGGHASAKAAKSIYDFLSK